ncbi:hypothetical protein HZ326_21236 [Fusarium oxysporum f. sp. albedinis]|nr:hypothetical protein HZ326_21236 [Fusarium oxysporum f. sp. albedinis]
MSLQYGTATHKQKKVPGYLTWALHQTKERGVVYLLAGALSPLSLCHCVSVSLWCWPHRAGAHHPLSPNPMHSADKVRVAHVRPVLSTGDH